MWTAPWVVRDIPKGFAMQLGERGTLVAIDQDDDAITAASERLQGMPCKIKIAKSNFKDFGEVLDGFGIEQIDGIFFEPGCFFLSTGHTGTWVFVYERRPTGYEDG